MSAHQRLITRLTNTLPPNLKIIDYLIQSKLSLDEPATRMLQDLIREVIEGLPSTGNSTKKAIDLKDIGQFDINKISISQQQQQKDLRQIVENLIKELKYDNALYELEQTRSKETLKSYDKEFFEIFLFKLDFRRALVYAESLNDPEKIFITAFATGNFEKAKSLFSSISPIINAEKSKYITVYELFQMQLIVSLIEDPLLAFIEFYERNNIILSKYDYDLFSEMYTSLKVHNFINAFNLINQIQVQMCYSCFSAHISEEIASRIRFNIFTSILQSYGRVSIKKLHQITNIGHEQIISYTRSAIRSGKVFGKLDLCNEEFFNQNENPQFLNREICDKLKICVHKMNLSHQIESDIALNAGFAI